MNFGDWLIENKEWVFSGIGVTALTLIVSWLLTKRRLFPSNGSSESKSPIITATNHSIVASANVTATASDEGIAVVSTAPVTIQKDPRADKALEILKQRLAAADLREQEYRDHIKALTESITGITALAQQKGQPDTPLGVEEALQKLAEGDTQKAEAIFQEIADRKKTDIQEAAEAHRNLGALAFLHDTQKALNAYRRATQLEPDNEEGWNQLGHLSQRTGQLEDAKVAYQHVLELGEKRNDPGWIAAAYGNLGTLYETRGELGQAEAMHQKSLALFEALGYQGGMANAYGNLGNLYKIRGELGQAEAMHQKSLAINEALGRQEGMASNYGNLGVLYQTRGELEQAEAMHRKSLAIDEALGRQEGMATAYTNLGNLYQTRGELGQAEAMHQKSLAINEALGYQEGMACDYTNLGYLYKIRGELGQAEAMYQKALALFQKVGAAPQIKQVQESLEALRQTHSTYTPQDTHPARDTDP